MRFDILTLFPEMVKTILDTSIMGRAQSHGKIEVFCHQIRDYSKDKHRKTDDTPYGGGTGLVMTPQPLADCMDAVLEQSGNRGRRVIYLSPKGALFTQAKARELCQFEQLILVCGHYEGVDQRFIDEYVDEELSIGDYVLTGGELPAAIVVDAVSRHIEGVLKCEDSYQDESIASGLLEYPHYTHPDTFHGRTVPDVLLSGHHQNIAKWRHEQSLALTKERRPDLYAAYILAHPEPPPKKKRTPKKKTDHAPE
ncbi:MAG: tRNA (guanosine(37)-N1)-methyltransferase TrmD [Clostridia bacterium]|nr:tRNA (guanosine(37)-N1)-methyltransferase TrmD [Clostridia bacterium]